MGVIATETVRRSLDGLLGPCSFQVRNMANRKFIEGPSLWRSIAEGNASSNAESSRVSDTYSFMQSMELYSIK